MEEKKVQGTDEEKTDGASHSSVVFYWCAFVGGLAEVELSAQGLVTDGVGKISSSHCSPVGLSQESLCPAVSVPSPLLSSFLLPFFSPTALTHSS